MAKSERLQIAWQVGVLTTVPFILVAGPLIGFWMGDWIDQRYATDPYGKAVLIFLGFAGSIREIVRIVQRILRDDRTR